MSDAHLRHPAEPNYRKVQAFLASLPHDLSQLVINGDFFDAWVGDNRAAERLYLPILEQLDGIQERGTPIRFVEGNHDFSLGDALGRRGYTVIDGTWRFELGGKRVLVEHGDLVTGDTAYRLFHAALRSPLLGIANAVVPNTWSQRLAFAMSHQSRGMLRDDIPRITEKLRSHGRTLADTDIFITGHTHVPMDEVVQGPSGDVRVINLGDWVSNFTYLSFDDAFDAEMDGQQTHWALMRYEGEGSHA